MNTLSRLGPFDSQGNLNVIVETPQGSRNKYRFDEEREVFTLSGIQPAGSVFPFDFGYIPGTRGGDGDPLDVLVLLDSPAFTGCVVATRLIGVIEAEQEDSKGDGHERNDRLIAVATESRLHADLQSIEQVSPRLLEEIEHFFTSYHALRGESFNATGRFGPERAREILHTGLRNGLAATAFV